MGTGNTQESNGHSIDDPSSGDSDQPAIDACDDRPEFDRTIDYEVDEALIGTLITDQDSSKRTPDAETPTEIDHSSPVNRIGRYKINGVLGKGGFGAVYLGHDDQLRRDVAIKVPVRVLTGAKLDEFLEEARNLAQLRHPGIVTVFDVGTEGGRCYIVSDYLDGASLKDWAAGRVYSWQDAARITASVADALSHSHSRSMVHRDVKPSNIMMLANDEPVLIDFGLAVTDARGNSEAPGIVAGTPSYMSPEQAAGKSHRIDGRTDIYSVGAVLYFLLCGKAPFNASDLTGMLRQVIEDEPQPLRQIRPDIPDELEQVCLKAMAKSQRDRYTTANDFADALRRVLSDGDVDGSQATHPVTKTTGKQAASAQAVSDQLSASGSEYRIHSAQRRQITALHLEFEEADEEEMADPEQQHEMTQRVRDIAAASTNQFGGHIARTDSNSVEVYFGFPVSYEDSARRAVLAGLTLARDIAQLDGDSAANLSFSIGIHTGVVVAEDRQADDSSERLSIVGNVPRVAGALNAFAESGSVVMTAATQQIVGRDFLSQSLGNHSSKRLGKNIELFKIDREVETVVSARESEAQLTPFVGREHERGLLAERWHLAQQQTGQVVLVSAEPGVGKSRLLSAFRGSITQTDEIAFEARCSTYHQNTAFHPIVDLLDRMLKYSPEDSDQEKLKRLEEFLQKFDIPLEATVPLLADLLSVPLGSLYAVVDGTPERRKQRAIETLVEIVLILSEQEPLLFTVEDLHWSDPSTLEFLGTLLEQIPGSAILLVMTYRPEFVPAWPLRSNVAQLQVSPLTTDQTAEVVEKISDERGLPLEVIEYIATRTDGVPLFAEELTRTIVESGILKEEDGRFVLSGPLESLSIPSTLQDSLMARLDRLGGAREIAQVASVIGREFTYQLLEDVVSLSGNDLQKELSALVGADLLHQRGFFPRARFTFRHALVQDAAYDSLLRTAKHQWHSLVADKLTARTPQLIDSQPELLAHHFTGADRKTEAIAAWLKAGQNSQEKSAYLEAISHYEKGLSTVEALPEGTERDAAEFSFLIPLGVSLLSTQGYSAPRVGPVFERAAELGRQLGGPVEQFHITWGIWAWRVVRDELDICMELDKQAWEIADASGDDGLLMEAHFIPALTQLLRGEFTESLKHSNAGLPLYDEERCKAHARHTGQNVGATTLCYNALALVHLGYPEQAVAQSDKAVELARSLNHSFTMAYITHHACWVHFHCGHAERALEYAAETLTLSAEQNMFFWHAEGTIGKGYGLYLQGNYKEGLEAFQQGVRDLRLTGSEMSLMQYHTLFAACHLGLGQLDEARQSIDNAHESSAKSGSRFFLTETFRVSGDIFLALPAPDAAAAEAEYWKSIELARSQKARLPELRATVSLGQMLKGHGRADEALTLLEPLLDWFEEGFDFPDLIAAAELRASLQTS